MKGTNKKFYAVALGYVNIIIHNATSLILTPTMISGWGDASYGLYKIILSLLTYFMLVDAGIRNTVVRFVSEYRSKNDSVNERRYIAVIISYYFAAAVFLTLIVCVFGTFVPQIYATSLTTAEIKIMISALPMLVISSVSALFFNTFSALLRSHNMQVTVQSVNIIRSIIRFVVLYFMVKSGCGVNQTIRVETSIAVVFALLILFYVFVMMKLPPMFKGLNKSFVKTITAFTSVMLVYTIATSLFWSVGNFLVGVMTSSVLAAVYATAITLTNMFQSLSSAISQVLVPDIMVKSFQSSDIDEMNDMMIRIAKIKLPVLLIIVLGFASFGKEFVHLWVGNGYTSTYIIALITMIPLTLGLLQDVPNNYMLAKNKHKTMAKMSLLGSLMNLIVSVVLINFFGIYGAVVGTLLAYFGVNVAFTYWYYKKQFGFNMKQLYIETLLKNIKYIIFFVLVGVLLNLIPFAQIFGPAIWAHWVSLLIKIVLFTSVFLFVYFKKMADASIKKKVLKMIGR